VGLLAAVRGTRAASRATTSRKTTVATAAPRGRNAPMDIRSQGLRMVTTPSIEATTTLA
jgi:hypothetical protein